MNARGCRLLAFLTGLATVPTLLPIAIMLNLVYGGLLEVGLPALAHGPLHAGANGYGIMLAAFGAGALVGGISGGFLTRLPHPWLANLAIWAAQGLAVVAIPLTGTLMGATIALGMMGLAMDLAMSPSLPWCNRPCLVTCSDALWVLWRSQTSVSFPSPWQSLAFS